MHGGRGGLGDFGAPDEEERDGDGGQADEPADPKCPLESAGEGDCRPICLQFRVLSPPKLQTYRRASGHNRLYITLAPPEDGDQEAENRRLEALGAKVVTVRVDGVDRSIMEDPEGPRELKVIGPVSTWRAVSADGSARPADLIRFCHEPLTA